MVQWTMLFVLACLLSCVRACLPRLACLFACLPRLACFLACLLLACVQLCLSTGIVQYLCVLSQEKNFLCPSKKLRWLASTQPRPGRPCRDPRFRGFRRHSRTSNGSAPSPSLTARVSRLTLYRLMETRSGRSERAAVEKSGCALRTARRF